ncbi:hypothetical protein N656DRAFT_780436 [Canariomyces notabilis]|uniref:YDG domain-containing protein n=1 Tax=Canariomyces notabilis TaxID=2074819 RepID=A0AAN6YQJ4_9PEZI|nr:hypothetical protein N656DRAFT_780436 [Canariomyces arenarius]
MQGIYGSVKTGAYSIVVSGKATAYAGDMDDDRGEVLLYSADGSIKHRDPLHLADPSWGTKCLQASLRTGNPVRVLRSAGPKKARDPRRRSPPASGFAMTACIA